MSTVGVGMPMHSPKVGVYYASDLGAACSCFADDGAWLDYLDWLRWPDGFRRTHCDCSKRVQVLGGTIFQDARTC